MTEEGHPFRRKGTGGFELGLGRVTNESVDFYFLLTVSPIRRSFPHRYNDSTHMEFSQGTLLPLKTLSRRPVRFTPRHG